jgi:sugar O-acyltransferase (sialic acid O-acetyltransferase NeuD family)
MTNIVLVGSSGHAKVIIDAIEKQDTHRIVGLLDRFRTPGEQTFGYHILGREEDLPTLRAKFDIEGIIVAIGDNFVRSKVVTTLSKIWPQTMFATVVHPNATIARDVSVGPGTVVMAGAVVHPSCSIGQHCIVNASSFLDHDSSMADFSSLAPRSATGGRCQIATCSAIGIGATLIQDVSVGEHTVVGANSAVLKSVGSHKVVYGSPAKEARFRHEGERYL